MGDVTCINSGISVWYQISGLAVLDQCEQTTDCTGNYGHTTGGCFEGHKAKTLATARDQDRISCPIVSGQRMVLLGWNHHYSIANTEFIDQVIDAPNLGIAFGAACSPNNHQACLA